MWLSERGIACCTKYQRFPAVHKNSTALFCCMAHEIARQQEDCKVYFKTMYHFKSAGGKGSFKIAETQQSHKSGDYFECVRIYEGYNLGMDFYDT